MEGIKRAQELLEELAGIIAEVYPEYTDATFGIDDKGYRSIKVTKWDEVGDKPVEKTPRRTLLMQSKCAGDWSDDQSKWQNEYCKEQGCYLEG